MSKYSMKPLIRLVKRDNGEEGYVPRYQLITNNGDTIKTQEIDASPELYKSEKEATYVVGQHFLQKVKDLGE